MDRNRTYRTWQLFAKEYADRYNSTRMPLDCTRSYWFFSLGTDCNAAIIDTYCHVPVMTEDRAMLMFRDTMIVEMIQDLRRYCEIQLGHKAPYSSIQKIKGLTDFGHVMKLYKQSRDRRVDFFEWLMLARTNIQADKFEERQ